MAKVFAKDKFIKNGSWGSKTIRYRGSQTPYEILRWLGFGRCEHCKESSWEHLGTRGGRGKSGELLVGSFFLHIELGEILGIRGCFAFLLVIRENKGKELKQPHT